MLNICCLLFKDNISCWSRNVPNDEIECSNFRLLKHSSNSHFMRTIYISIKFYKKISSLEYDYENKVHIAPKNIFLII